MSAHVLLILLNKLGKREKNVKLAKLLSRFCNDFKRFNDTGARMLDSIYYMTLKLLKNCFFGVKTSQICILFAKSYGRHYVSLLNL